jgi:hypothetical protein
MEEQAVDTSQDEHLSEQEALDRARAEGIEFEDQFHLESFKRTPGRKLTDEQRKLKDGVYPTREKAEKALTDLDNDDFHIVQSRRQKL